MGTEYFASVMTPGIALLILSTTMRLGNVRLALTELVKTQPNELTSLKSYQLFTARATYLCTRLRALNLSLLALILGAMSKFLFVDLAATFATLARICDYGCFILLFMAVVYLYLESRLTGKSIIALTQDMQGQ